MHDSWQVYYSQHAQPPILRCGPAWLSHWRFRVQIITLISKDQRVRSFRVIWIRIGDPRSVWIMAHQKNRWIHDQSAFADRSLWCTIIQTDLGSLILFQVIPKERSQNHFAFGLQYKWYGNTSDMYSLTCRASKSFDSQSKAESTNTENFEGGPEYSLHSFPQPHTGHLPDCLHLIHMVPPTSVQNYWHEAIKLLFLTLI